MADEKQAPARESVDAKREAVIQKLLREKRANSRAHAEFLIRTESVAV